MSRLVVRRSAGRDGRDQAGVTISIQSSSRPHSDRARAGSTVTRRICESGGESAISLSEVYSSLSAFPGARFPLG